MFGMNIKCELVPLHNQEGLDVDHHNGSRCSSCCLQSLIAKTPKLKTSDFSENIPPMAYPGDMQPVHFKGIWLWFVLDYCSDSALWTTVDWSKPLKTIFQTYDWIYRKRIISCFLFFFYFILFFIFFKSGD